ncbi:MAG: hypothetical protein KIS66_09675 [Fimbriimonadaceae bacterium]|nr:hypothetical protein [Fimbriimonadaceae bacterium]
MNRYLTTAFAITAFSQGSLAQPLDTAEPGPPRFALCRASTDTGIGIARNIGHAHGSLAEKAELFSQEFDEELPDRSYDLALEGLASIHEVAVAHPDLQVDFTIDDNGAPSLVLDLNGDTLTCRLAEGGSSFGYGVRPFVRFGKLDEGVAWLLENMNSLG